MFIGTQNPNDSERDVGQDRREDMSDIMWLFVLHRQLIWGKANEAKPHAPFTPKGKARQKDLRQRKDGKHAGAHQKDSDRKLCLYIST